MDFEIARTRAIQLLEEDNLCIDRVDLDQDVKEDLESLIAMVYAGGQDASVAVATMRAAFMLGYYYGK